MPKELKHPKPPRNLKSSNVTYDSVTLDWVYEGANTLNLIVNDEDKGIVSGGHHELTGLTPQTEYTIKLVDGDGNESNEIKVTTLEHIKATHVYFAHQYANVIPNKPTRLQVLLVPENATDKRIELTTDKGIIKDGYITLENVDDVAHVVASLPDGSHTSECTVLCVAEDVPVGNISATMSSNELEIGQEVPIGVGYTPSNTTQRAVTVTSSKPKVIKVENVDGNFRATGLSKGTSTISIVSKYDDNVKIDIEASVIEKPVGPSEPSGDV